MFKYDEMIKKVVANDGMYETKKYIYTVYFGLHTVLYQFNKETGKKFAIYTIL
jgi:hypothetical protein